MKHALLISRENMDEVLGLLRHVYMRDDDPNRERIQNARRALETMLWSADTPRTGEFEEGTMRIGVDHYVSMGEALAEGARLKERITDAIVKLRTTIVDAEDGDEAPVFSEHILYERFGKDDARTILALIDDVARAANLDPYHDVDRAVNARLNRMVRYTAVVQIKPGGPKDFVDLFREHLRPHLTDGDSVPRFSRPVERNEAGERIKVTDRVIVNWMSQDQYTMLNKYVEADDNLEVVESKQFYDR